MSANAPQAETDAPPTVYARRVVSSFGVRVRGAVLLVGCAGILGLAGWLHPDPRGYGTHEQLGTAPCGMLILTGYPCPTCGMTTAFSHVVRGQWWRAVRAQPAGFVFALATFGAGICGGLALVRGRWPRLGTWFASPLMVSTALLTLLVLGWVYKIVVGRMTGELPYR